MQKNTPSHLHSKTGTATPVSSSVPKKGDEKLAEPSSRVIDNILNYSKALQVKPLPGSEDFIEYLVN